MDTNLQARIRDLFQKNDKIAIAVGKNPTLDDIAAALSLYLGINQLGKKASIASAAQPLVEHSSLVGIDKVKSQLDGDGGDLVVSFPYREGEIEKVSYTIENGLLNIVVKAGEQGLAFEERDVRYSRGGGAPQVLFIVGTPRLADLGALFNPEALKDTTIVNIDNKQDNQGFGDIVLVSQTASSVSEVVGELLLNLGVDPDVDIAQNLLSGISFGTDNFQSPKTTYLAFEMVATFMKKGAHRQTVQTQQNEERVSSFMPEQMLSQGAAAPRTPVRNPFLGQQMPNMTTGIPQVQPRSQQMPHPQQQQVRPQVSQQRQPLSQQQIQQQLQQMQQGTQQPQVTQQPRQQGQTQKPPSDWLAPKVYKGSSNVS
ncbi:MAG: hypothetical protein Q8Q49_05105 [bacterium]|nr:hypothetical protein [bacterium]